MRHLPALFTALLLPAAPPFLFGTVIPTATLLVSQTPAQAQSAEVVAKVAQAITVRIEGATQGSGVLVKREGNRYTVLTAWHVVSDQNKGEELDIFVRDGTKQQLEQGSIKRLGEVDLAVLTFTSNSSYEVAQIGDIKSVSMGNPIWVSGFPLPSSAIPTRLMRFIKGDVIANATVAIPHGYQLLYDNQTLPGVSGGAVLNAQGQLVGIHGKAEKADQISESSGKAVATGTNQGVPITYYEQYVSGAAMEASTASASSADDYLAQAKQLLGQNGKEQEVIRLSNQVLATSQSAKAYSYRGIAKYKLGDKQGAITDNNQAIAINPQFAEAYVNRGFANWDLGHKQVGIADISKAIAINPQYADAYYNRGIYKVQLGDSQGAIADYIQAISINPRDDRYYNNRGIAKAKLGDSRGATADWSQAIAINPQNAKAYLNRGNAKANFGDKQGAIADFSQAIVNNPSDDRLYLARGFVKADLGDNQGAIADYNQSVAINPQNAEAYLNRGVAKSNLGNKQGAVADYNQAIAINPQNAIAYNNLCNAKVSLGDKQGAIADCSHAIAINPQFSLAYTNRGKAKSNLGDKQGAIADYNQAIAISPQYADAYTNRGNAKSDLGDKQGACADYKKAISLGAKSTAQWFQSDGGAWCRNIS